MKKRIHFEILPAVGSALAGWLAMILPFAVWMLVIPHGPGFAPEIGPMGSFLFFGAGMTAVYFANHAVALIVHFVFQLGYSNATKTGLAWGVGFAASVPFWFLVLGGVDSLLLASIFEAPFAFLSGFAAGYFLHRLTKQKKEPNQPPQTTRAFGPRV